ncbi:hypothetical protein [Caldilinea sp.]|uniref:hypothetical protein n=1 Tax=Caldilinea sp. TaxID=2293560 RepID=UPI0021DCE534|nr:hypothetical protein [Caldilinea sp.]GIV73616.1 MAG: hypothetical protein KatS3mg049_2172 [Caldilinea sp.]
MIEYKFIHEGPESGPENGDVWMRSFFEPLTPGALTPFTSSLFAEVTARTWYLYFDRLGFDPPPRSRLVKVHAGRPYVNLSISARLDAERAGVECPPLLIDGNARPLVSAEKPGFFAGIKLGRSARKIEETLDALQAELPDLIARVSAWYQRVMGFRWSQAEILLIMEEIERVGANALLPYFAARHNLERAYRRLLSLLSNRPTRERVALIAQALGGGRGVEVDMAQHVSKLAQLAADDSAAQAWLQAGEFVNWKHSVRGTDFGEALRAFMATYGHRSFGEGEMANPRWDEKPDQLLAAVRRASPQTQQPSPTVADPAPLLAAVDGKARKEAQQLLERMRRLLELQSGGLHAFSYILAGARRWALAAGEEAAADHRLTTPEDVFFYEIEEVKEMMTGEWNISDRSGIHATAAERRAALDAWRRRRAADLLWGEREATVTEGDIPLSPGRSAGALVTLENLARSGTETILLCPTSESAAAAALPACTAIVVLQGSPIDPLAACARALGRPAVVAAAVQADGALPHLLVDGNSGKVLQS